MTRIQQLREQIASIPEKDKRKELVGTLRAITGKAADCAVTVESVAATCNAVQTIDGATFVPMALQAVKSAARCARQLRKQLVKGATARKLDDLLTSMGEETDKASKLVSKGWSDLVDGYTGKYRPLNEAAEKAHLPGAPGVAKAHARISLWKAQCPQSPKESEMFRATIQELHRAVENLGLEGKAGDFLIAAAGGRASARDLQNDDVVSFLNQNPGMWNLLRVTL